MNQKNCKNCAYYSEHYVIIGTRLIKTECGHCKNYRHKSKELSLCKYFVNIDSEPIEIRVKKSVNQTLELISKRLTDLTLILKDFD